jgi:phage tail-like protein
MDADVESPVASFYFRLTLGGPEAAGFFAEAGGLKFPGQARWSNVTLKRGVDEQAQLWAWRQTILDGAIDANRRDVRIDVLDGTGASVVTYELARAWPCKYSAPGLNAGGNEILVEELELVHEGVTRA